MNTTHNTRSATTVGTIFSAVLVGGLVAVASPVAQPSAQAAEGADAFGLAKAQQTATANAGDRLPNGMTVPMKNFEVTALFGNSSGPHAGRSHGGLDMAAPTGTRIVSATSGKVIQAGSSGGYGNLVTVKTETGQKVMYAHMSKISVKKGDKVKAGQELGKEGNTGNSTGPHLHLEVHSKSGKKVDPLKFLGVTEAQLTQFGK